MKIQVSKEHATSPIFEDLSCGDAFFYNNTLWIKIDEVCSAYTNENLNGVNLENGELVDFEFNDPVMPVDCAVVPISNLR